MKRLTTTLSAANCFFGGFMFAVLLMMLTLLFSSKCSGQTYPVPTVILDSLIFETMKGRECSRVLTKKNIAIAALQKQIETAEVRFRNDSLTIENKDFIIGTWQTDYFATVQRLKLEKANERKKARRLKLIAIGEGILIILLVI